MRQHYAFRFAGRAAGVDQRGNIARIDRLAKLGWKLGRRNTKFRSGCLEIGKRDYPSIFGVSVEKDKTFQRATICDRWFNTLVGFDVLEKEDPSLGVVDNVPDRVGA